MIPELVLERFAYSASGTFGILILPSGQRLATVERPWLDNKVSISCIPVGEYHCSPRRYNRGGYDAYIVNDVPGRTYILFHIGNYVRNSNGCILVNSYHGATSSGEWCGRQSKTAFDAMREELGRSEFKLKIINRVGGIL